ncbi:MULTISPECIES: NAD(P)/FAD-dependent oxidoreductase [Haloarcula]|uniref:Thioredoxin reductase n=1 Tax=Haloarcula pellucida TaxID=1427151 RepID=A0A830GPH1_9EURY|nr:MULTISPECIES: FAD-dependent oxidoreductase [Halomicroarcula]MBX0349879.1 FAD-dependent oxidoreductase [Halomicroarcula pellucida]MDS0279622.1 FAD-dependent oxidoreductase [Halomicroarcula sp. S1AR25-4]GGN94792.1 thioredoxin reductase [Halomicroarcula pellucida]
MTEDVHDLVIAGSGIAGLSAAVYAARADLDPLLLEGDEPGGQLTLTTDVENYLGFPDGVGGMELVQRGKSQAEQFGAEFQHGRIESATLDGQPLELSLSTGDTIRTRALVVATGASARWVGAENEAELMGHGLSTCATCDGAFHRGDDVLVVGGGDSAMEEALFLAKFADSVTVVHRREELRASEIMADRVREHENVRVRWNTELEAIHGSQEEGVTGATLVSHPDGFPREKAESGTDVERETVDVGGVFYAVGHTPNTEFLDGTGVERDGEGYVRTRTDETGRPTTNTAVNGVFAAGDVADPAYRQAITAAGTGSMAALDAEQFLETLAEEAQSPVETPA